jgi:tetratricopeptide (TPR) repeat protein
MMGLAASYTALGRHADALKLHEETLALWKAKLDPDHPDTLGSMLSLGNALEQKGDLDRAMAVYRTVIGLNPKRVEAHTNLGYVLERKRNFPDAIAAYRKTIELDPKYVRAYAQLGSVLCENGDVPAGLSALQKAAELKPDDAYRWYCLADAHLTAGQRDAYRQVCADMMKRFGKSREPAVAETILYTCLPTQDALDDVTQLLPLAELAATREYRARLLGAALYRTGKYEAAIERLDAGVRLVPPRAWDHLFRAMAHHRLGHAEKARDYLELAVGQIEKAGYPWTERVESEHLRREAEALMGIHRHEFTHESTIAAYRRLLGKNPNDARLHNELAWLLATCPDPKFRHPGQAVKQAQEAVELAPKDGLVWNTLGVAHYRAGDWKAAIMTLEESMGLRSGRLESSNTFFLAMTHCQLGNKEEARKWYDRAVRWMDKNQPDNEELRRFRAEASALLGIKDQPKAQRKSDDDATRPKEKAAEWRRKLEARREADKKAEKPKEK